MPLMCHEVWFVSPQRVIRIDLPMVSNVQYVMDYVRREYQDRLPDSGTVPFAEVSFLDGKGCFVFHDGMILLPNPFLNESEP